MLLFPHTDKETESQRAKWQVVSQRKLLVKEVTPEAHSLPLAWDPEHFYEGVLDLVPPEFTTFSKSSVVS